MPNIDWIIEILANSVYCAKCGKVENHFPMYIVLFVGRKRMFKREALLRFLEESYSV